MAGTDWRRLAERRLRSRKAEELLRRMLRRHPIIGAANDETWTWHGLAAYDDDLTEEELEDLERELSGEDDVDWDRLN